MVNRLVAAHLDALVVRFGIAAGPAQRLVQTLAGEALKGPFRIGGRRFSAINRDGVPFQWSISVGPRGSGLRFITDCGIPGTSIAERVRHTRATLQGLATWLPLADGLFELDRALECLLPPDDLLNASLMGLCVATELACDGTAHIKVYVNGEIGDAGERYRRMADCLAAFHRNGAATRLRHLAMIVGDRLEPAFVAIDVESTGLGRLKLYFRPTDGTPALQALAASAIGCNGAPAMLETLHCAFLVGDSYPARAVDVSVEFPVDDAEPGFKVDLRTISFLGSDAEADSRIRDLLTLADFDDTDYRAVRDIVVGQPVSNEVRQIVFVGFACRRLERKVDVYFHPGPWEAPS